MSGRWSKTKFKILPVEGFNFSPGDQRFIGFVEVDPADKFVNAKVEFDNADIDIQRGLRTGIQQWLIGVPPNKRQHGWTSTQHGGIYTGCYVFKHTGKQIRMYGFLFHPKSNPRALFCGLMHYTTKNEDEVNTTILDRLNELGANPDLIAEVDRFWKSLQEKQEE